MCTSMIFHDWMFSLPDPADVCFNFTSPSAPAGLTLYMRRIKHHLGKRPSSQEGQAVPTDALNLLRFPCEEESRELPVFPAD